MSTPRVFVGTLYCKEGDFQEHCKMISLQRDVNISHHVIADLPEKDAHNSLWDAWNRSKTEYDLFVKIDADTVLRDEETIKRIWALFEGNPRLTGIQAPLHDYMTDGLINGLNCFSPKVIFNPTNDGLYCDRGVDTGHDQVLRQGQLPPELEPAGYHCHHATDKQAFHYGLHRALKGQADIMLRVQKAWLTHRDRIRGLALAGTAAAPYLWNHNYNDPEFESEYQRLVKEFDASHDHPAR
jgi:hypothetical protein